MAEPAFSYHRGGARPCFGALGPPRMVGVKPTSLMAVKAFSPLTLPCAVSPPLTIPLVTNIGLPHQVAQEHQSGAVVAEAFLYATTVGFHEIRVNGAVVGQQQRHLFEPGQSSYTVRALYTSYNITADVIAALAKTPQSGAVRIAAMLGNGPCSACDPQKQHIVGGKLSGYCTAPDNTGTLRCTDYVTNSSSDATCCKKGVQNAKAFRAVLSLKVCNPPRFHIQNSELQTAVHNTRYTNSSVSIKIMAKPGGAHNRRRLVHRRGVRWQERRRRAERDGRIILAPRTHRLAPPCTQTASAIASERCTIGQRKSIVHNVPSIYAGHSDC